jgi:integrase
LICRFVDAQRDRSGSCADNRAIPAATIRKILAAALARTGLTDPSGAPLHYTPHDFRRMLLTDAKMNGLTPHIAEIIAGHRDARGRQSLGTGDADRRRTTPQARGRRIA